MIHVPLGIAGYMRAVPPAFQGGAVAAVEQSGAATALYHGSGPQTFLNTRLYDDLYKRNAFMKQTKILLPETDIPKQWYNVAADLKNPPTPESNHAIRACIDEA